MKDGDWRVNRSPSLTFEAKKELYYRKKAEIFDALGNKCKHCGHEDILGELAVIVDMAWKYQELEH